MVDRLIGARKMMYEYPCIIAINDQKHKALPHTFAGNWTRHQSCHPDGQTLRKML
jgi:hypothetical protein